MTKEVMMATTVGFVVERKEICSRFRTHSYSSKCLIRKVSKRLSRAKRVGGRDQSNNAGEHCVLGA